MHTHTPTSTQDAHPPLSHNVGTQSLHTHTIHHNVTQMRTHTNSHVCKAKRSAEKINMYTNIQCECNPCRLHVCVRCVCIQCGYRAMELLFRRENCQWKCVCVCACVSRLERMLYFRSRLPQHNQRKNMVYACSCFACYASCGREREKECTSFDMIRDS